MKDFEHLGPHAGSDRGGFSGLFGRTGLAALAATALVAVAAAAALSGSAGALSTVDAVENINPANVPIGYSPASPADSTWTSLGSLTLTPGASYAVVASVGLHETAANSTGVPATAECVLSLPNEPLDLQDVSLVGKTRGSYIGTVSLQGLTQLIAAGGYDIAGSANLLCRSTSPGAAGLVLASDARLMAIPVDTVVNNLATFRCGRLAAPPC